MAVGIQKALEEANGAPLHIKDILVRAMALGVESTSADPMAIFDGELKRLMEKNPQIEKTAPRTYRLNPSALNADQISTFVRIASSGRPGTLDR